MSLKVRNTLYSITLVVGLGQTIVNGATLGSMISNQSGLIGFAPYMHIFHSIAIGWSAITWIWTSVLLAFNNRPLSSHTLTRSLVHFESFVVLAIGWLAIAIMLGAQFHLNCNFERDSDGLANVWCGGGASSFVVALFLWVISSVNAFIIYRATRKLGGLSVNIAECGASAEDGA